MKVIMNKTLERFDIVDSLDYAQMSDEVFFNTIAAEAENLRYIVITWTEDDFQHLIHKECILWARKFHYLKSQRLLDLLDEYFRTYNFRRPLNCCFGEEA